MIRKENRIQGQILNKKNSKILKKGKQKIKTNTEYEQTK